MSTWNLVNKIKFLGIFTEIQINFHVIAKKYVKFCTLGTFSVLLLLLVKYYLNQHNFGLFMVIIETHLQIQTQLSLWVKMSL